MSKTSNFISCEEPEQGEGMSMSTRFGIIILRAAGTGLRVLLLGIALLVLFGFGWVQRQFGGITLDIMVLQMSIPLKGTGNDYFSSFILQVLVPSLVSAIVVLLLVYRIRQRGYVLLVCKKRIFPNRGIATAVAAGLALLSVGYVVSVLDLPEYLILKNTKSDFIEKHYIAPAMVNLTFPEQKRNLVYIYMESMESTFLSVDQGGQMTQDLMPELHQIAQENTNISDTEKVGGAHRLAGMEITSAGIVAQTSGLPLILHNHWAGEPSGETFVKNAVTLGDILAENGYTQYFMVGSEATFGARDNYYKAHGDTVVYDLLTARQSGVVAADYDNHFWGMEDAYLYQYAKKQLVQIAAEEEPFCFTMLTVDTHFPDGYVCSLCEEEFGDQYANVLACASRQLSDFLQWMRDQDFYESTTVVISGDHLTMSADFFDRNNLDTQQRRVYNVFINTGGVRPVREQNRVFASIDMFPSTLAAMGVEIEGEQLGLGTNLFSDKPTLLESYGYEMVNQELSKKSEYYFTSLIA